MLPWVAAVGRSFVLVLLIAWTSLALYYSNLPWAPVRTVLAIAFALFGVWAAWVAADRRFVWILTGLFICVLIWWITIRPTHAREWRAEVAVMPRATIDGDRVTVTGIRNFEYRSVEDFTPRYETREMLLSDLVGVDFFISYWAAGPVGHTFLSFVFEHAPPLNISIEARPESSEGYDPVASLFKQFELIYVVGDERDIVGVRTNHRGEDVYMYELQIAPESARKLFLVYMQRINELADRAEFYHLLRNNCTVNIVRYANAVGRNPRFDIRHYLNGLIDGYLYDTGRLYTGLPLEELQQRSLINDAARAAGDGDDFSARIRASLPTSRH